MPKTTKYYVYYSTKYVIKIVNMWLLLRIIDIILPAARPMAHDIQDNSCLVRITHYVECYL